MTQFCSRLRREWRFYTTKKCYQKVCPCWKTDGWNRQMKVNIAIKDHLNNSETKDIGQIFEKEHFLIVLRKFTLKFYFSFEGLSSCSLLFFHKIEGNDIRALIVQGSITYMSLIKYHLSLSFLANPTQKS